jgi:hypothetical protein
MDKTDLSLLLSALGLAVSLGIGLIATSLIAAFAAGLLIGRKTRRGP